MKELPQVLVNAKVPNHKKNIYLEDEQYENERWLNLLPPVTDDIHDS